MVNNCLGIIRGQRLGIAVSICMHICMCIVNSIDYNCVCAVFIYMQYSKTCVRQPPLKFTLVVDVERLLSYKGTCHVILLAKLHDIYLYKTDNFFHIYHYLKSVSKVALLHRFYCILQNIPTSPNIRH